MCNLLEWASPSPRSAKIHAFSTWRSHRSRWAGTVGASRPHGSSPRTWAGSRVRQRQHRHHETTTVHEHVRDEIAAGQVENRHDAPERQRRAGTRRPTPGRARTRTPARRSLRRPTGDERASSALRSRSHGREPLRLHRPWWRARSGTTSVGVRAAPYRHRAASRRCATGAHGSARKGSARRDGSPHRSASAPSRSRTTSLNGTFGTSPRGSASFRPISTASIVCSGCIDGSPR